MNAVIVLLQSVKAPADLVAEREERVAYDRGSELAAWCQHRRAAAPAVRRGLVDFERVAQPSVVTLGAHTNCAPHREQSGAGARDCQA